MDQKSSITQAEKDYKKQQKAIDKAYKEAQGIYSTQAAELQQMQPQFEQSVIQGYESQRPILEQGARAATENIGLQRQATEAGRESALSSARRAYQEGLQRTQQTFGGVGGSSAGLAAGEYIGAETQRQMGQTRQTAAQNLQALGIQERDIQAQLTNQLQQLEVKKQQDLLKTRDLFRQELNQINSQKAALGLNKANAQLQALTDYNARKRQIEDFYTEQRVSRENYAFQLAEQNRYGLFNQTGTGTTTPKWLDLKGFGGNEAGSTGNQQRAQYLVGLLTQPGGADLLASKGFVTAENFFYNPSTGEGYDINGIRFPDFAVAAATRAGESPYDTKYRDYNKNYRTAVQ